MEKNVVNKFLSSVISKTFITLVGLAAAVITIYAFIQDKKVNIRYEIIANSNVLDFNADLSDLAVMYDSTNLKETKENLRIITLKIVNNGNKDILNGYYDENEPLGIRITAGKIIEKPEIIHSSNEYIRRNLKIQESSHTRDRITFSKVILEQNEFYIVKLLILHKKNQYPRISPLGKIAGQKTIEIVNASDVKVEQSFWTVTFGGNFWTHLLRLLSYFSGGIIIILLIVTISDQIDTRKEKKRKRQLVDDFKNLESYEYTRMDDAIFDRYRSEGARNLRDMKNLLSNENRLNELYWKTSAELKSKEFKRFREISDPALKMFYQQESWDLVNKMISDGILFKEHESLKTNHAMKESLGKFLAFLSSKGEFRKNKVFGTSFRN